MAEKKRARKKTGSANKKATGYSIDVWPLMPVIGSSPPQREVQVGVIVDYRDVTPTAGQTPEDTENRPWINVGTVQQYVDTLQQVIHGYPVFIGNLENYHTYQVRLHKPDYHSLVVTKNFNYSHPPQGPISINDYLHREFVSIFVQSNPSGATVSYRILPSGPWIVAGYTPSIGPSPGPRIHPIPVNSQVEIKVNLQRYFEWKKIVPVGSTNDENLQVNLTRLSAHISNDNHLNLSSPPNKKII